MTWERIPASVWEHETGHVYRYELAAQWINDGETVIDAACGIGYGAQVIAATKAVTYLGVDQPDVIDQRFAPFGSFESHDLDIWTPTHQFDVAVCFETLEHLHNPEHMVSWLKQAKRLIILSVPTIPTKHFNEFHLHDFTVDDILGMFTDAANIEVIPQPEEYSHIFKISTGNKQPVLGGTTLSQRPPVQGKESA